MKNKRKGGKMKGMQIQIATNEVRSWKSRQTNKKRGERKDLMNDVKSGNGGESGRGKCV